MTTKTRLSNRILQGLESVLGHIERRPIGLHEPCFEGNESRYTQDCIESGWVSSVGQYVDQFERQLEVTTGIPHAIAMVNGTAALHLGLKLIGVTPDDEVLVPALTFVATANAVSYCGATPHFVEACPITLGVDPEKLESYLKSILDKNGRNKATGKKIKALIVVHTFGHAADLFALQRVCDRFEIALVEDAAESLGSYYNGLHTGQVGRFAALSFNGNKIVTTGGGGALLTHDPELARLAKHMSTTAKKPHTWEFEHDAIGYNYRLPNLNAALGCAQIEQLQGFVTQKTRLAEQYRQAFANDVEFKFYTPLAFSQSNHWLNTIILTDSLCSERDAILQDCHAQGFQLRPVWKCLSELAIYSRSPRMKLETSEKLEKSILNLPSSPFLAKA